MQVRSIAAGVTAGLLVLTLAACGDDDGGEAADEATTTEAAEESSTTADDATTTTEAEEPTESTEAETPDDGTLPVDDDVAVLLVTAADFGEGFADGTYETQEGPGPCGVDIDAEYPYDGIVGGVAADEARGLGFQQELRIYADEATATEVLAVAQDALSCGSETADEALTLDAPVDLTADLGAPAFAVSIASGDTSGALITVQVGQVLSVYQFQGPTDFDEADGPDTQAIVAGNVAEIQAALG